MTGLYEIQMSLIVAQESLYQASVCVSVHTFKHEYLSNQRADHNQILSEASLLWGKAALGFGPDRIGTLVSNATYSSHRVIMGKT